MPTVSKVSQHPGSSAEEIADEPAWTSKHSHRVGYRNEDERFPGLTHEGDSREDDADDYEGEAIEKYKELRERVRKGDLVNFQDVMKSQPVCGMDKCLGNDGLLTRLGLPPPQARCLPARLALRGGCRGRFHQVGTGMARKHQSAQEE